MLFLCAEPFYGRDAPLAHRLDPSDNKVERAYDGNRSLNAQQDAKVYEIEDLQPVLACHALLEHTTRTDQTTYGSAVTQGHGTNTTLC
jgi:hypothetical protein